MHPQKPPNVSTQVHSICKLLQLTAWKEEWKRAINTIIHQTSHGNGSSTGKHQLELLKATGHRGSTNTGHWWKICMFMYTLISIYLWVYVFINTKLSLKLQGHIWNQTSISNLKWKIEVTFSNDIELGRLRRNSESTILNLRRTLSLEAKREQWIDGIELETYWDQIWSQYC
jgi:hypothetical protein